MPITLYPENVPPVSVVSKKKNQLITENLKNNIFKVTEWNAISISSENVWLGYIICKMLPNGRYYEREWCVSIIVC